jgi:FixJ family two-component response regulator
MTTEPERHAFVVESDAPPVYAGPVRHEPMPRRRKRPRRATASSAPAPALPVMREPTVYVVDDSASLRKSIACLIKSAGLAVETFASAKEFLDAYDADRPGCLVLDVRLQHRSGLDLQATLVARNAPTPIIFVTAYGDVPTAVRAMRAGAVDFIQKPFSDQLLLDRIWQAIERDQQTRRVAAVRRQLTDRAAQLTPREREIFDGLVAGQTSREIARALDLSVRTVEAHRARVLVKMEVESVARLVRLVLLATPSGSGGGFGEADRLSGSA